MTDKCGCEKDTVKKQSINQLLDKLIKEQKQDATKKLINTLVVDTLYAISSSMKDKAAYPEYKLKAARCGTTKYSNDFVNAFEPIIRKKITKMLKDIS
jgi:AAA+ ATPase superfamily predicted ATPase